MSKHTLDTTDGIHPIDESFAEVLQCLKKELSFPSRALLDTAYSIFCFRGRLHSIERDFLNKQRKNNIAMETV